MRGADRLRDAEDDAAGERAPEAAEPADDHRLEGVDQPGRPDGRIEIGADAEEEGGDAPPTMAMPGGQRVDASRSSMPIRPAVDGSSEVARKARPSAVR